MKLSTSLFLSISAAGVLFLWGRGLEDGMVLSLLQAMVNGTLPDGTSLRTLYTGIPGIDHLLTILVAFFYNITRDQPAHRLFLSEAYTSLVALYVIQSIEASRTGRKPRHLSYPSVWGFFAQSFGAGCVFPIYFLLHLDQPLPTNLANSFVPVSYARTLIPSSLIGGLLPAMLALAPLPRSDDTHQIILAAWQCYPMAISLINKTLASTCTVKADRRTSPSSDLPYLRAAYIFAFLLSFGGHVYSWSSFLLCSKDLPSSFSEIYLPSPSAVTDLKSAAMLFLQYDWICIASSALLWGIFSVAPFVKSGMISLVVMFLAGFVFVGPGAVVSLAFFWREGRLRESLVVKKQ